MRIELLQYYMYMYHNIMLLRMTGGAVLCPLVMKEPHH